MIVLEPRIESFKEYRTMETSFKLWDLEMERICLRKQVTKCEPCQFQLLSVKRTRHERNVVEKWKAGAMQSQEYQLGSSQQTDDLSNRSLRAEVDGLAIRRSSLIHLEIRMMLQRLDQPM